MNETPFHSTVQGGQMVEEIQEATPDPDIERKLTEAFRTPVDSTGSGRSTSKRHTRRKLRGGEPTDLPSTTEGSWKTNPLRRRTARNAPPGAAAAAASGAPVPAPAPAPTNEQRLQHVKDVVKDTPITGVVIKNPESKFVVATYWWGRENMNRNLQYPCVDDITNYMRNKLAGELGKANAPGFPKLEAVLAYKLNQRAAKKPLTNEDRQREKQYSKVVKKWVTEYSKKLPPEELKRRLMEAESELRTTITGQGRQVRETRTFTKMIEEWTSVCEKVGVNYIALNTEFKAGNYQFGINAKPLFIRKLLDDPSIGGRAVVYIDGDEWFHTYPHVFDIEGVDFMARGWNIDSRSKPGSLENPFYDPYTLETSGGIMYFGNTQRARMLLDEWAERSEKQLGKADDRILSMIFTMDSMVLPINIVNLPIEYLWLTDFYEKFLTSDDGPASIKDVILEHPYCLTGDEQAEDQGAAADRNPAGYEESIEENINYYRPVENLYEYIMFNERKEVRDQFGRYLQYLKTARRNRNPKNPRETQDKYPLVNVIDFADSYGKYTNVATSNLTAAAAIPEADIPLNDKGDAILPKGASIPQILRALSLNRNVWVGIPTFSVDDPEDECIVYDNSTIGLDQYTRYIQVDTTRSMYFSNKSAILKHLLAMCKTISDINVHLLESSYLFMSRIRWNLKKAKVSKAAIVPSLDEESTEFPRIVHQIWFGPEPPAWRKYMFEANRRICEENGFRYRLWRDTDRTAQNFPSTFGYQNDAIEVGKEMEQNRLAQVADLARLEIVYNHGGIYIDSLIEISPAFLSAIVNAVSNGARFVGCNEDPCEPPTDCVGNGGKMYLTNSFFAASKYNIILDRLLKDEVLAEIDLESEYINRTTGPYFLRTGIQDVAADKVFMLDSAQVFPYNNQPTPYKEEAVLDEFIHKDPVPGSIEVKEGMYYQPGGTEQLQTRFLVKMKGPLAIYHSGLGGTWSR